MAKKKKSDDEGKGANKKKLIGVVVLAVVAYKFVLAPKPSAEPAAAAEGAHAVVEEGPVVPLPELVLNLADEDTRYLRVGLALILEKGTPTEHFKEELPIASDVAVDVLSEKTYAELREPGAKQHVKEELSEKVREAFHGEKVARVIFTSFVMQ
jgi:flagellar protein FliL